MPYLLSALGALIMLLIGLVAWIGSRLWEKMDNVEVKVDEHNVSSIARLSTVETKVDNMDSRVKHIERIVLNQNPA